MIKSKIQFEVIVGEDGILIHVTDNNLFYFKHSFGLDEYSKVDVLKNKILKHESDYEIKIVE